MHGMHRSTATPVDTTKAGGTTSRGEIVRERYNRSVDGLADKII